MSRTDHGSGITRSGGGTGGNPYTYTVAADFANRPVNYVSYWDACRFANWLNNDQYTTAARPERHRARGVHPDYGRDQQQHDCSQHGLEMGRHERGRMVQGRVPQERRQHGRLLRRIRPSSDSPPGQDMADPLPGNNANYYAAPHTQSTRASTRRSRASSRTRLARTARSTKAATCGSGMIPSCTVGRVVCVAGRSSTTRPTCVRPSASATAPLNEYGEVGFRVVSVPEPGSITLLVCGAVAGLIFWRRWR